MTIQRVVREVEAADSRLDSLELGGFATRTEGKPLRWHINTEGRQG